MSVTLRVLALGAEEMAVPTWVVSCDVDGRDGRGTVAFTTHVEDARRFATASEAMQYWQRQSSVRPLRNDGKPNRPLTAFTIEVADLEKEHVMTAGFNDAETLRLLRDHLVEKVEATLLFDPFMWAEILDGIADRLDAKGNGRRPLGEVVDANDIGKWRADHPATSRKAALDVAPRSGTQRRRVLDAIAEHASTDDELQKWLAMNGNTERPRRVELVDGGWIEDSGERRRTPDGQDAIVWRLAREAPMV